MSTVFQWSIKIYIRSNRYHLFSVVIEELQAFKSEKGIDSKPFVDKNLKMVAFNFARQSGMQAFIKMMVNLYDLVADNEMFVDKIRDIINEHNYKDVRIITKKLRNQHFYYENVLIAYRLATLRTSSSYTALSRFSILCFR